jgi:formylglycine-generating enzyme required for sulfatase activity/GTPase SAR1 family protein
MSQFIPEETRKVCTALAKHFGYLLDIDLGSNVNLHLPPIPTNYALGCTVTDGRITKFHISHDQFRESLTDHNINIDTSIHAFASAGDLQYTEKRLERMTLAADPSETFKAKPSSILLNSPPWENGIKLGITPIYVTEVTNISPVVILVGQLGSGKTTLLRQICRSILLQENDNKFAILINLREKGQELLNALDGEVNPLKIFGKTAEKPSMISEHDINALANHALESGSLMVLLDGLDEVTTSEVDAVSLIKTLKDRFCSEQNLNMVISSRKSLEFRGREPGIVEVGLGSFTPEEVKSYIESIAIEQGITSGIPEIDAIIRKTPDLATRPLFMRAFADYIIKGKDLSKITKVQLMEELVDTLLTRWTTRRTKEKSFEKIIGCPECEISEIIERISLGAFQEWCEGITNAGSISINTIHHELISLEGVSAQAVNQYFTSEIGVVCLNANKNYYFPHRSVGEYLAARALSKLSEDELLPQVRSAVQANLDIAEPVIDFLAEIFTDKKETSKLFTLLSFCVDDCKTKTGDGEACLSLCSALMPIVKEVRCGQLSRGHVAILNDYRDASSYALQYGTGSVARRISLSKQIGLLEDGRNGIGVDGNKPSFDFLFFKSGNNIYGVDEKMIKEIKNQFGHDEIGALSRESPSNKIQIGSYELSRFPVTVSQFELFINDPAGYMNINNWIFKESNIVPNSEQFKAWKIFFRNENPSNPITQVSWYEAQAFCKWAANLFEEDIRLPTELEWENAARGEEATLYPWGNQFDKDRCNWLGTGNGNVSPVGSFYRNGDKFPADIVGNVWEWTTTLVRDKEVPPANLSKEGFYLYSHYPVSEVANRFVDGCRIVVRGGCYLNQPWLLRTTFRASEPPVVRYRRQGFRVAKGATK